VTPAEAQETKREIQVEVPADVVARETEAIVQKLQQMARLPGFRRGKVPASIIRQRFAEEIRSELVESLVPRYFREQAEKQKLQPVSQPRVSDLHIQPGEALRFRASFEILPEIDVSGYKEVVPDIGEVSVTDDEVEQALNNLREQNATYTPVEEDRGLADGDFAQVSFTGHPHDSNDPAAKPVNVDDILVEIGGANTVREFSENLRGARAGEERKFDVTYAQDFSDQRLAGKTISYTAKVNSIKSKSVPELTDDFAKELGSFASLDELRAKVRESLESEKQHAAEHQGKEKLIDELVRRHDFPLPESLLERQIDVRLERGLRALAAQGMRAEDMKKMDLTRLRAGQRDAAAREVKASLLLDKIAETEHIEVADEEIEQEVEQLAKQMNQPAETVRARLTRDGALDRIRNRIRNEKTLDYLYRRPA
jgi:trigger factor